MNEVILMVEKVVVPLKYLGSNDLLLLTLLAAGDSYGYKLSRRIRELSQDKYFLKETTLYAALNRLEREGSVTSYAGTETNGKERTYFSITPQGRQQLSQLLEDWRETVEIAERFIEEGRVCHDQD